MAVPQKIEKESYHMIQQSHYPLKLEAGSFFFFYFWLCWALTTAWTSLWFRRVGAAPQDYPLVRGLLVVAAFLVAERGL